MNKLYYSLAGSSDAVYNTVTFRFMLSQTLPTLSSQSYSIVVRVQNDWLIESSISHNFPAQAVTAGAV
jgi:hypothetical protein